MPSSTGKIPKWVTEDLLEGLKREVDSDPSRQKYIKNAPNFQAYYRGETQILALEGYDIMPVDPDSATARYNKTKEAVDKLGSLFMKNEPMVRRWPYRPEDGELADDLDAMFMNAWDETNGNFVIKRMLNEAQITGMSVGKIIWNAAGRTGDQRGAISFTKLAPESIRFDPRASNSHRGLDARYIIHTTRQRIGHIIQRFGTKAAVALGIRMPQGRPSDQAGGISRMLNMAKDALIANLSGRSSSQEGEIVDDFFDIDEVWIFPHTMYDSDLVSGDDLRNTEYPYGLVITAIENKPIRAMANPFVTKKSSKSVDEFGMPTTERTEVGHRRHPFVPLNWSAISDPQGKGKYGFYDVMGIVESIIPLQTNLNALRQNVAENARTTANPVIVANEDALAMPPENLVWTPGQVLWIKEHYIATDALHVLQGTSMPQYVLQMIEANVQEIEKMAGIEPGVIGLFPTGGGTSHTPGITIGALQEAAFGPLWVYVAELGAALLDIAVLYDGLIQQKYKPESYLTVSAQGQQNYVQWTTRHITAHFKRRVVNGATTPLYDLEREQRVAMVREMVLGAVMSGQPVILEVAIAELQAMNFPWAYQFIQILERKLDETMQNQKMLQAVGEAQMLQGQQGQPGQQQLPAGQGDDRGVEMDVINMLAEESGMSPEEVAIALGS